MTDVKTWNITEIEEMTEKEAQEMASDKMNYKGYNVYFIDFGGYFGFSRVVFKNGKHIHYTNDYQLHHKDKTIEELKKMYINGMKYKLFEYDDMKTISGYEDYEAKNHWIRNYFPMEFEHYSMFVIGGSEKDKQLQELKQNKKLYLSTICFCYFEDIWQVEKAKQLLETLENAKEKANTLEYWIEAFKHELFNHEYLINYQGNWDVFSAFGNVTYKGDTLEGIAEITDYMKQLGMFDKMHLDAFKEAYNQYYEVAQNY